MLNRRILRVKAMQALFSYQRSREAGVELAEEEIANTYKEEIHNTLLEEQKPIIDRMKMVQSTFRATYKNNPLKFDHIEGESDQKAFLTGINFYRNHLRTERNHYQKVMLEELNNIYASYLMLLSLPGEFAAFVSKDRQRKRALPNKVLEIKGEFNLENNFFIRAVAESTNFRLAADKNKISWASHSEHIISWYKEILKTNPDYISYQKLSNPTVEEDLLLIRVIYRDIVFGNDVLNAFLEEHDLWWSENKSIIKNMIKKTVKTLSTEGEDKVGLVELLINEEEDLEFFKKLYNFTLDSDEEFETVIGEKAENWDKDRVSAIDKNILKMAMTEFLNFPSIPVKVTINEYIELSKNYSTPKSKQFVNGILDRLSEEWLQSGRIRKSGRGLMDNK